jgi:hypothetical protein
MPLQPTLRRPQSFSSTRTRRVNSRVTGPTLGQCFDIEVIRDTNGWMARIPEINASARAYRRAAVESAARECIAEQTGIPIGYIAVFVSREIV